LAADGTKPVAGADVSSDAGIRCLARKSSVERACVPSRRSNGDGRAKSADGALVCCKGGEADTLVGVGTVDDLLDSDGLDKGAFAPSARALPGDIVGLNIVGRALSTSWVFTLPLRDDSCGLTGVPPRTVSLPSRVAVCSVLELVLEFVAEVNDSSLCSAGS
jgi:hypothetical protein